MASIRKRGSNSYIMTPRNLCNSLLHKFLFRISGRKFRHILQISDRKSLVRRIISTNIH